MPHEGQATRIGHGISHQVDLIELLIQFAQSSEKRRHVVGVVQIDLDGRRQSESGPAVMERRLVEALPQTLNEAAVKSGILRGKRLPVDVDTVISVAIHQGKN